MTRADVDALSAPSGGAITAARLEGDWRTHWPTMEARPCGVRFDAQGKITSITFRGDLAGISGLENGTAITTVRASQPDCRELDFGKSRSRLGYRTLALGEREPGTLLTARFRPPQDEDDIARLDFVILTTWDEVHRLAASNRAYDARKTREAAERAAAAERRREAASKLAAWKRTADPDDVLRHWASEHSAWGESPTEWARFADWLIEESTPEDRHRIALDMNWDHGLDIFFWIIRQPDTQLATVFEIFWLGEPEFFVGELIEDPEGDSFHPEGRALLTEIGRRVADGFYRSPEPGREIAFAGRPRWRDREGQRAPAQARAVARLVPDAAFQPIDGRDLARTPPPWRAPVDPGLLL